MMIRAVDGSDVRYSDGIAAWHTMIAVKADVTALQRRLPEGWDLAPHGGDDLPRQGDEGRQPARSFFPRGVRDRPTGRDLRSLSQVSYVAFVFLAHNRASGALDYVHWLTYTEDPAGSRASIGTTGSPRSQTVMMGSEHA
jgi:hypothetical protein